MACLEGNVVIATGFGKENQAEFDSLLTQMRARARKPGSCCWLSIYCTTNWIG
jgi:hypothetical protein